MDTNERDELFETIRGLPDDQFSYLEKLVREESMSRLRRKLAIIEESSRDLIATMKFNQIIIDTFLNNDDSNTL